LNDGENDVADVYEDTRLLIDGPGGGSPAMDSQAAIAERVTSAAIHDSPSVCGGDERDATIPVH
jgi:hypothetical protein